MRAWRDAAAALAPGDDPQAAAAALEHSMAACSLARAVHATLVYRVVSPEQMARAAMALHPMIFRPVLLSYAAWAEREQQQRQPRDEAEPLPL